MKKKKKSGGLGGLYIMIAVCVVFSCVAVFGLMGKLETYQESEDSYAQLQQAALTIVDDEKGDQTDDKPGSPMRTISPQELLAAKENGEDTATTGGEDTPVYNPLGPGIEVEETDGPEEETVVDEALIWMLNNQTEDDLITDFPKADPTPSPNVEDGEPATEFTPAPTDGKLSITANGAEAPVPTVDEENMEVIPVEHEDTLEATATVEPTKTPAPTPTVPPYVPASGISMEHAVTVTSARYAVDFDYLTLINDDVVGWLYQEGTAINYPVLRGEDNEFYLNHLFDGTVNSSGSVFMDSGNSAAFIDSANYLYGHHSKGGGMFASLSEYLDPAYYEAHPQFLLVTPFSDYQVDVFAGMATLVEDEVSWRPKTLEKESDLYEFLDLLRAQSFIQAPEESFPLWGDRMLVLVTCTNIQSNQRYVIYGRMRPIVYETTEESISATKAMLDARPTGNGYVEIEGLGTFMHYAQNDELWYKMRYEARGSSRHRSFGNGGCGPTAAAIAIANLCPVEELPRLIGYANTQVGYTFCDCSVNRYFCDHTHAQYQLRTEEEFLRYMPLAVANFVTGNNIWDMKSRTTTSNGTNMRFLEKFCAIYGIRVGVIKEIEELYRRLEEQKVDGIKRMAIACASYGSPFTDTGHYVVLCGLDEEYVYFLDPWRRDNYAEYDRKGYAEMLELGVVRIKRENLEDCCLSPFYLLEKVQ